MAKEEYVRLMEGNHDSFEVTSAGLCVNPKAPHLGASPDGLIFCSCCGSGVLEVIVSGKPYQLQSVILLKKLKVSLSSQENTDTTIKSKVKCVSWRYFTVTLCAELLTV